MIIEKLQCIDGLNRFKILDLSEFGVTNKLELDSFFKKHAVIIEEYVATGGGLYFKNLPIETKQDFFNYMSIFSSKWLEYSGAKVRSEAEDQRYLYAPTSTPPFIKNYIHNEVAYQKNIPEKICLFCDLQSEIGGESLISCQAKMVEELPKDLLEEFKQKKISFHRVLVSETPFQRWVTKNFSFAATFPSWQKNFATEDKSVVEKKLAEQGFDWEWTEKNDLISKVVIDPLKKCPTTGRDLWVNNAHLFQLNKKVYGFFLYNLFKLFFIFSKKPKTSSYYGDDSEIPEFRINQILEATERVEIPLKLTQGDALYFHNWAFGHGRYTFKGKRRLYFGLLE